MAIQFDQEVMLIGKAVDKKQHFATKEEMKNFNENYLDKTAFATCDQDGGLYVFNVENEINDETGKWRQIVASIVFKDWKTNNKYKVGDYVVYDHCLLKCIEENTSTDEFNETKFETFVGIRTEELKDIFTFNEEDLKLFDDVLPGSEEVLPTEDRIILNYYYSDTGALTYNGRDPSRDIRDISSTIYRKVQPNSRVTINTTINCKHAICEYDENKNFISISRDTTALSNYTITTSPTTKYVRIGIFGFELGISDYGDVYNATTLVGMTPTVCNNNNIVTEG